MNKDVTQSGPSPSGADDGGEARLREAAERYCNWGKWGDDDQVGTLNYITPDMVVAASRLVQRGKVISLAIDFGGSGPQQGFLGRFNPMTFMLRDGDDAYARSLAGAPQGIGGADDVLFLPTQGATQWDALGHIFYDSRMWNGYDCRLVSSMGAERNDIAQYRDRIVGRAVLLDIPRALGIEWCEPGQAIDGETLDATIEAQGVSVGRGDIVLLRFGQMAQCRAAGGWGTYAGGDAPGLSFDSLGWIQEREIAALASDTWGVEVRPNEMTYVNQPWHRVALPQMGLCVGEIFDLEALAADCAGDGVYEMFFCANPLPVIGSVGGPINPTAIK
jgi:kynurenine formamidase